jgi:[acyl-carrier-protein] S-malonyltransferase
MGRDVADRFPVAREVFQRIDDTLGFSISKICFEGSEDDLKLTANTQPAILAVSSAIDAVLASNGRRPEVVAGHSLGEYSAIVAAGGLDAAEAASIVRRRGEFMQAAVPVGEGAMAAIIGPSLEEVQSICDEAAQGDVVSPANINAPGQIVIAGSKAAVDRAIAIAKGRGIRRALPLPVSAPFHCALMMPAEQNLAPILGVATFHELVVPLVTNVEARPVTSAGEVRDGLVRQVVSSVRWVESVERMIADGVTQFVEVGPGAVLAGLIKRINADVPTTNINNVETLEAYLAS